MTTLVARRDSNRVHLPTVAASLENKAVAPAPTAEPSLARHPDDAFRLAEPYPMNAASRRVFRALIVALCPPPPAPQPEGIVTRVEECARRFIRYMHPAVARVMAISILLIDFLPILTFTAARRFSRLGPQRANEFVARLAHSRFTALRTLIAGLRGLILSVYFDQSEVHAALGYHPVPFMKERMLLRGRLLHPAPVAAE